MVTMSTIRTVLAMAGLSAFVAALPGCSPKPAPAQAASREGGPDGASETAAASADAATPSAAATTTTTASEPVAKNAANVTPAKGAGGHPAGTNIKIGGGAPIPVSPATELGAWLETKMPKGGKVEAGDPPKVKHTVQKGETLANVAETYLELSELYTAAELANAIAKKNPTGVVPGKTIEIPTITSRIIRDPKEERFGWPADKVLRGLFVTGPYAGIKWVETLDKMAARGINAVVLDGKDYEGYVNYPTKAKVAVETKAAQRIHIPDLARAIRFAHWRGIHVIIRIPCFHDPWADKHAEGSRLSLKFTPTGKPIHVDWIDPTNKEAQDYAIELAQEALDAGADEIQLDYVRFPVHLSRKVAVLPEIHERKIVIRDFVRRVKQVTAASNAALSLDFFGVAATGERSDIEALGQDIATVAPEADAVSLMSYPSHYSKGYMGWTEPADHPEVVGMGNKAAVEQLKPTGAATVWRTWLQAFPLRVTNYGPQYVVAQAKSAESTGGLGWLMWSPGCEYSAVYGGWPVLDKNAPAKAPEPKKPEPKKPAPVQPVAAKK